MQNVSPDAARLAARLRQLRQDALDGRLTQASLARALGAEESLSSGTVSSWESESGPKLPPQYRLQAYARFFATRRSVETQAPRLLPLSDFSPEEMTQYEKLRDELINLRSKASEDNSGQKDTPADRSWRLNGTVPVIIVCAELPADQRGPLADPSDPNRTKLHGYADTDSLAELFGHIRAENPFLHVEFKTPSEINTKEDLNGHLVLLGGVVWNTISQALARIAKLPVKQVEHPRLKSGEIFVSEEDGQRHEYWPEWTEDEKPRLSEDIGLLARMPNPLNSSFTLTICNGIHSRGVYGAVRSLTDSKLRASNERYIATNFGNARSFAMLMRVQVINDDATTPDFNGDDVVVYKWSSSRPLS